jgi:hypothetical protein
MPTINYLYPVAGAAPSTDASSTCSMVVAQLVMTDLDTIATITHNFVSSNINPPNLATDLASGFPTVNLYYTTAPTTTVASTFAIDATNTNFIVVTKAAQAGSAFTGRATIGRPNTLTR